MEFWDFVLLMVWGFLFISYLMVLFSILTDLFRDRETSGFFKAVWVVFLIVLPLVTALVYLVARGRGMAERGFEHMREAQAAQDAYIRSVAAPATPTDEITHARSLLDDGVIDRSEFEILKAKALT